MQGMRAMEPRDFAAGGELIRSSNTKCKNTRDDPLPVPEAVDPTHAQRQGP